LAESIEDRRSCIVPNHPALSIAEQCRLLGVPRASYYYRTCPVPEATLLTMRKIDALYMDYPFLGSRRIAAMLGLNRKQAQRLMRLMGIEAHYPKPRTSTPAEGHEVYPYLLRGLTIERCHQVWSADITYIPMAHGFLFLVAVMDWHSRFVLSWRLSNTLDGHFCRIALDDALRTATPEIWNSDQGAQFTSAAFLAPLKQRQVAISMDGRGRALDNVFIERLWRSVKYEVVYPGDFRTGGELHQALEAYFSFYNFHRPHQALDYRTPADLFFPSKTR